MPVRWFPRNRASVLSVLSLRRRCCWAPRRRSSAACRTAPWASGPSAGPGPAAPKTVPSRPSLLGLDAGWFEVNENCLSFCLKAGGVVACCSKPETLGFGQQWLSRAGVGVVLGLFGVQTSPFEKADHEMLCL